MLFENIIGQPLVKSYLVKSAENERVPHAQLFLGAEGVGGLPMALAFSQFLVCQSPDKFKNADNCGTCDACRKAQRFIHPDIHFSFPTVGSKLSNELLPEWRVALEKTPYMNLNAWLDAIGAENKQGNIYAKECDEIIKKLNLKSYEGGYKILILWMPELLGNEGNRLLKIIEEPPANTIFILVAEQFDLVLNTIISRTQLVKLLPLPEQLIEKVLLEEFQLEPERAKLISFLAEGNYLKAQQLITEIVNDDDKLFVDWLRLCYRRDFQLISQWVEQISGGAPIGGKKYGRKDQKNFIEYGLHYLRELGVIHAIGAENAKMNAAQLAVASKMANIVPFHKIEAIRKQMETTIRYIERNANPKISFMNLSISILQILHSD
jgi:DNA polymerase-3 subunit delta'